MGHNTFALNTVTLFQHCCGHTTAYCCVTYARLLLLPTVECRVHDIGSPRGIMLQGVVKSVEKDCLTLTDNTVVPFGLCIWSTGVGPTKFTLSLPFAKTKVGRIAVGRLGSGGPQNRPALSNVFCGRASRRS